MIIDIYNKIEYRNYVIDIINNYCIDNDIDIKNIYPTQFNCILEYVYDNLYSIDNELLKDMPTQYNDYNKDKVLLCYSVFKYVCNYYCMEISLKRFELFSGIDHQTFYNWESGLSGKRFDLHQKIMKDNEESLSLLMQDRRNNPMKYLPKLNKVHEWNMPGVRSAANKTQSIGFSDLPQLSENSNNSQLIEKSQE